MKDEFGEIQSPARCHKAATDRGWAAWWEAHALSHRNNTLSLPPIISSSWIPQQSPSRPNQKPRCFSLPCASDAVTQVCKQPLRQRSYPNSHWSLATAVSQPIPTSLIDPSSHLPIPIPRLLSRAWKESPHHHAVSNPVNPDCVLDSSGGFLKFRCPDLTPDQLNHHLWGWGLGNGMFIKALSDTTVQLDLPLSLPV